MSSCLVNISIGELYDKYSILEIKLEKIKDTEKRSMIQKEMDYLSQHIDKYNSLFLANSSIQEELKKTNEILWVTEDAIREKEQKQEFDAEFITLARRVYITNDKRSYLKKEINNLSNSDLFEIKSYSDYCTNQQDN